MSERCTIPRVQSDGIDQWHGREGVLWYYRELAAAFTIDNPVVRDLRAAVTELDGIVRAPSS
jgi:hypothetical protein